MRLIDADELIVMEYGGIKFVPKEFIDDAPPVDAVPVIRCKYCKHHDDECLWCKVLQCETENDCYCSLAKERLQ